MTLTKSNIVNLLSQQLGLPKKDCLKIVNAYFEEISKGLERGEEIKIPKLGNFIVKHKKSRPGRNPKTGKPYNISDRNVVSFKASKKLRESL
tara:strand:+ start:789 stop:1064 length:276 start_codon:yes stop_codon:yes gene_type:complete